MAEIRSSAAYVRHEPRRNLDEQQVLRSLQHRTGFETPEATQRIWALLETPQTVQSISRALAGSTRLDAQRYTQAVEEVLAQLFDADLIEIAPDS